MAPSAPLSHVNYKVVHNIIRMLIHGFCMNGKTVYFEVHIWDTFEVSLFSFVNLLNLLVKNGTPVCEVPVHLKASVLNSGSCLLPATAASSESLFLWRRFENWKRSLLLGLCVPRVCMLRHIPSHTHASRWSVHGHVYGKGVWQVGFGFAWHQENLHRFFFCKEHHFPSVKENPCITHTTRWPCQSSEQSKVQLSAAWEHRECGSHSCAALLCPQGQLWEPGLCSVCSHSLAWSARAVLAAPAWERASCQWEIGCTSALTKPFPLQRKMSEEAVMLEEEEQYFSCSDSLKCLSWK